MPSVLSLPDRSPSSIVSLAFSRLSDQVPERYPQHDGDHASANDDSKSRFELYQGRPTLPNTLACMKLSYSPRHSANNPNTKADR